MIKAVVFDMDGVLFDTEKLCLDSWDAIAKENGVGDVETVFLQCVGRNSNDTRTIIMEHYGEDFPYDTFRKRASEWTREYLRNNGMPIKPGVREILEFLKGAGYEIGLASSSGKETVLSHLQAAGLLEYFSVIVTGDMVEHSKPNPDIYLLACEEMKVAPEAAYAIEDSPNGIRAAHAAGMSPIMVPDLIAPDDEMKELSFRIFKDLYEVKDFFQK